MSEMWTVSEGHAFLEEFFRRERESHGPATSAAAFSRRRWWELPKWSLWRFLNPDALNEYWEVHCAWRTREAMNDRRRCRRAPYLARMATQRK